MSHYISTKYLVLFLLVFLMPTTASSNDSSLYDSEISPNAAFIRLAYIGEPQKPALKAQIAQKTITIASNTASPYIILKAGTQTFSVAGVEYNRKLKSGQQLNMVFQHSKGKPVLAGEVSTDLKGRSMKNKLKAQLHLFNFLDKNRASLETGDGKHTVIKPVSAGAHDFRAVNPITTALRVSSDGQVAMRMAKQRLKERLDYSFLVFEGKSSPIVIFSIDSFKH